MDFSEPDGRPECTIQLDVGDVFSWIVKFRKSGVIVNNRDMICSTFLNIDATVSFKTVKDFFLATSPSGKCETINTDSEFHYKYSGDALVLNYMWVKLLNIGMSSHVVTHSSPKNQNEESKNVLYSTVVGSGNGSNMKSNTPRLEVRGISQGSALGLATSASGYSSGENEHKSLKILKHGALLKKKDILAGWQSRYFVLQQERVSYFLDEFTYRSGGNARGVTILAGADISPVKLCIVNGADHFTITVEPKIKGKSMRLLSTVSGWQGKEEISEWRMKFQEVAAVSSNLSTQRRGGLISQTSGLPASTSHYPSPSNNNSNNNNNNNNNKNIIIDTFSLSHSSSTSFTSSAEHSNTGSFTTSTSNQISALPSPEFPHHTTSTSTPNQNNLHTMNIRMKKSTSSSAKEKDKDKDKDKSDYRNRERTRSNSSSKINSSPSDKIQYKNMKDRDKDKDKERLLRFPGDLEDREYGHDDHNTSHDKTNVLFYVSAILCLSAGFMSNGLIGAFWSGILIIFLFQVLPA